MLRSGYWAYVFLFIRGVPFPLSPFVTITVVFQRMLYLCLILGALAGVLLFEYQGIIPGVIIGYLVYQSHTLRKTVQELDQQVLQLERALGRLIGESNKEKDRVDEPESAPVVEKAPDLSQTEAPDFPETIAESVEEEFELVDEEVPEPETSKIKTPPTRVAVRRRVRREPNPILEALKTFLTGGNWLLRIGVAILFIGLSFLVRLAIEYQLFPLELRLLLVGLAGIAMIVIGWRLVGTRPEYGLVMEGGGLAVLYLTVFASFRLYGLLSEPVAAISLILITLAGIILGIYQNAQWVSVVSMLGGFFAPVLVSTESGSHIALFSYYAILNLGILYTAWFKGWRFLNLTGFLCTFGIGTAWGGLNYNAELFASTQPFLALFFAIYLSIAVLYGVKHRLSVKNPVDGTLVFGLPVVVFTLQASLVQSFEFGLAISSLIIGLCYLGLAFWLRSQSEQIHRTLIQSFDGIGIALVSMVIPFSVNATWTGIGWALEGAALAWLGIRQQRVLVRASGYILVAFAAISFIYGYVELLPDEAELFIPVLNPLFMGFLTVSLSLLFVAYQISKHSEELFSVEFVIETTVLVIGVGFWLAGGFTEIHQHVGAPWDGHVDVLFSGLSAWGIAFVGRRLDWVAFIRTTLFNLPVLFALIFIPNIFTAPFEDWGMPFWVAALVLSYMSLYLQEGVFKPSQHAFIHASYVWLIAVIGMIEGGRVMDSLFENGAVWEVAGVLMPLVVIPAFILYLVNFEERWPIVNHKKAYLRTALMPLFALFALISVIASITNGGDSSPLPYIPVLNPLGIVQIAGAILGVVWFNRLQAEQLVPDTPSFKSVMSWSMVALLFIWLNATIARSVHHWVDVPYTSEIWVSPTFQTALSICWTLLAVVTMAIVARQGYRTIWMVAASLLAVVVVKLFIVDLSILSTVQRIISFIGVGVFLLIIGYLAPAPPRKNEELSV